MTTRIETTVTDLQVPVPPSGILSAWSAHDWSDGVHVTDLVTLESLVVETQNNTYEIVLLSAETAEVLVRGGAFFPVFTPVRLAGSSLGGAFLKLHSIHIGFRLELGTDSGFIITSPVRSIARTAEPTHSADIM
jgi:hypothetical protein